MTTFETCVVIGVFPRRTVTYSIWMLVGFAARVGAASLLNHLSSVFRMQFLIHPVSVAVLILFLAVVARAWRLYRS